MAAVLCDGSPASLKALELAVVPHMFFSHDTDQLLLLHGWKESKDPAGANAILAALDTIHKSRVAAASLNYKIETIKLQSLADLAAMAAVAGTPVPMNPTPVPGETPASASGPKDKAAAAKGAAKAEKTASPPSPATAEKPPLVPRDALPTDALSSLTAAVGGSDGSAKAGETVVPGSTPQLVAGTLAKYAQDRCKHHRINNLLLGVGSATTQGKAGAAVGSVAKEICSQFRSEARLFFLKASGPLVRPTAALRMLVLVIPGLPLDHLKTALSFAQVAAKSDRVGVVVVANNGKPKPAKDVVSLNSVDADGVPFCNEVAKQCTTILAEAGLVDVSTDDGQSTAAESFPLINYLTLEPTNALPTPTVDESPSQLTKFVTGIKVDFLVLPPKGPKGEVGDALVAACLAAPKPHILLL